MSSISLAFPARRKPGVDEGPYRRPDPLARSDSPLARRRQLLRWIRSRPDLASGPVRVIEAHLDRISTSSPSLVTWDSIETLATRVGLSRRSVLLAHARLLERGMILRLSPSRFRAWLEAIGHELGYRYPEHARRPSRFTILLFQLPPEACERARVCAIGEADGSAKTAPGERKVCAPGSAKTAPGERKVCAPELPDFALRLPYREFGPIEFEPVNRQADGSLDPGGKNGEDEDAGSARDPAVAELRRMAEDPDRLVANLGRLGLKRLGLEPPGPSPSAGHEPPPAVEPSPASGAKDESSSTVPAPSWLPLMRGLADGGRSGAAPDPRRRLAGLIRALPGGPAHMVAAATRELLRHFREGGNEVTGRAWRVHLGRVRDGTLPVDLACGLVVEAMMPGVEKGAHQLSKAFAFEWDRVKNRSPGVPGKSPGDRP